ncbi:MAG: hypothetical protein RTV72_01585 [Candidatus Thorarchaeota archaeon]
MQITTDELPPITASQTLFVITDIFLFLVILGFFVYFLHRHSQSEKLPDTSSMKPSLTMLTSTLLLIALFGPSNLNIYPIPGHIASLYLIGMSWEIIALSLSDFVFSFAYFLVGLPFMFLRLVFVYQVYKYYLGGTSRKRVVITGILGELQLFLIGLAIIPVGLINPDIAVIISVPIPILLLAGLAMIRFYPRSQSVSEWTDLDEGKEWWEAQEQDSNQ